ncbi:hypothetical protein ACLI1C_04700 [Devosia sp. XGJD_8]|uniref:hypothetical protein n=1 Tax=Devosia sp. XGJD_8 TaxID=3391187 RepID=UPI0039856239
MKVDLPSWSVRNPLGTIALFISLIYGVCALLLGASISSLEPQNQTILVLFIALFPVLILGVFAWLVSVHHKKLYGPGDYRTDESFLQAAQSSSPEQVGSKLQEEIAVEMDGALVELPPGGQPEINDPAVVEPSGAAPSPSPAEEKSPSVEVRRTNADLVRRAYFAESLALQELQRKYDATIKRNVSFSTPSGSLRLDGIISTQSGELGVEITLLRSGMSINARLRKTADYIRRVQTLLPSMRMLVVLMTDDEGLSSDRALFAARTAMGELSNVEFVVFDLFDLSRKYGLTLDVQSETGSTQNG